MPSLVISRRTIDDWAIDILLWVIYLSLFIAAVAVVFSVVRTVSSAGKKPLIENGLPVNRLAWLVALFWMAVMLFSFFLGDSSELQANGKTFSDQLALRLTDMFIYAATILIAVAILGVLYGLSGMNRKWGMKNKSKK